MPTEPTQPPPSAVASRGPAYRIETPRLVLRCWSPADAPALHEAVLESLRHLSFLPWSVDEPRGLPERVEWLRQKRGDFDLGRDQVYGVFDRAETRVLGGVGFHRRVGAVVMEIGYWIRAGAIDQGLAKEAASALCRVGFEVERIGRLEIRCDPDNGPSAAVARRLGFQLEGTLRRAYAPAGRAPRDTQVFGLLPEEYAAGSLRELPVKAFDVLGEPLLDAG